MGLNKIVANADEAIKDIPSGATLMLGGFGLCGPPRVGRGHLFWKGSHVSGL